jgi:hypothetical protein
LSGGGCCSCSAPPPFLPLHHTHPPHPPHTHVTWRPSCCFSPSLGAQVLHGLYHGGVSRGDVSWLLEAVPDLWAQLRGCDGLWLHPAAEALLCAAVACPGVTARAQRTFLDVALTGGPLRVSDEVLRLRVGAGARLRHLAPGMQRLGTMARCSFTPQTAPRLYELLSAMVPDHVEVPGNAPTTK